MKMRKMKGFEFSLLRFLRQNARESLTDLSKKVNVPISTLYDRLRRHKLALIKRFTVLLDYSLLGYHTRAVLIIKVKREDRQKLKKYFTDQENVNSAYKINNGYDYLVDCIFKNIRDLEDFISDIEEKHRIKSINVYYIIDEIVEENFFNKQTKSNCSDNQVQVQV